MSIQKIYRQKKIRSFLIFFSLLLIYSCQKNNSLSGFMVGYEQSKATHLILETLVPRDQIIIRLEGSSSPIIGEFKRDKEGLTFTPVIPFTRGESYEIIRDNKVLLTFDIPKLDSQIPPRLLSIHPVLDTVPENLLKMNIVFNRKMQQSQSSLNFIKVFDLTEKKQVDVFLPLENELWNKERTQLTLWLDPGRIKKDLIPNKELGVPLQKGHQYELTVLSEFQDHNGVALGEEYKKVFAVCDKDVESPNIKKWEITIPSWSSNEGLGIKFGESLDQSLVYETFRVLKDQEEIKGAALVSKKANSWVFIPEKAWGKGRYTIEVESRLEDLAGNNLNRLFDVDLENRGEVDTSKVKTLSFKIE